MSPASSGALEVERYIGACLFSSQSHNKGAFSKPLLSEHVYQSRYVHHNHNHHVHQCRSVDGWAGGLPLISFANFQRRNNTQLHELQTHDVRNPLSRLAVHTQGAPLILSTRYDHRKNKSSKSYNQSKDVVSDKIKDFHNQTTDAVSVNSDESSGSANLENVLPRIIKPRKRRKKDRKPLHLVRSIESDDCFSTDSGSPDNIDLSPGLVVSPYVPFSFDPCSYSAFNKNANDLLETPKLHHSFDEVQEFSKDISDNQTSSCQCRYCDPCGQIWDVDRHCYSPFLTTPEENQNSLYFPDLNVSDLTKKYDASLSTNFMKCLEKLSLEDRSIKNYPSTSGSGRDLEVSTEIVTSLNGHRDLEIKFFSSSTEKGLGNCERSELITNPVICK